MNNLINLLSIIENNLTIIEWNEWKPWSFCMYRRVRRNIITNLEFEETGNASCSLISIKIYKIDIIFNFLYLKLQKKK
jgi:hypothetical protein